jgi:hypothetical protein
MASITAPTASIRSRLAGAVLLLSLASAVGCAMTTMTASSARVPVLVGPVACIGCSVASSPALPHGAPISDRTHNRYGHMWLPYLGDGGFFGASPPQIDLKSELMAPDACKGEIRVSALRVESFGVEAFLYGKAEQTVDLTGDVLGVPSGACGPRLWPYSGPRGIVYFDRPGATAGGPP